VVVDIAQEEEGSLSMGDSESKEFYSFRNLFYESQQKRFYSKDDVIFNR